MALHCIGKMTKGIGRKCLIGQKYMRLVEVDEVDGGKVVLRTEVGRLGMDGGD